MIEVSSNTTTTVYEYDAWCQPIKVTTNAGKENEAVSETAYDVFGRTLLVIADGKTTAYTYDDKGNVLTITDDEEVITYTYAENGNLVSKTNSDGTTVNYTYDSYGNLTGHMFNGYAFTYNTLGSILTANSGSGELVNYTYSNTVNQEVLSTNFSNGQSIFYTYNEDENINAVKFGEETKYGFSYFEEKDSDGNVTKEWTKLSDYVNNIKKVLEENKTIVNDFNGNLVYSVEYVSMNNSDPNSFDGKIVDGTFITKYKDNIDKFYNGSRWIAEKSIQYNKDGQLFQTANQFVTTEYGYADDSGLVTSLSNSGGDIQSENYSYSYDEAGRITNISLTSDYWLGSNHITDASENITYSYDAKGQLISSESDTIKNVYSYDARGNIISKKEYTVTLDENNEKLYTEKESDTYIYDETWKDKLTSYNGQTISYDASGNPISYLGHNLKWTMGRQLASFDNISYTYDENGMRASKTVNDKTTKYYYDGTRLIKQTDGYNPMTFLYDRNEELVGFFYGNQVFLYVKNLQGDITGIITDEGFLAARYTYDDWGNCISIESGYALNDVANLNPFRYRGYYYDNDTGLYYLQSRYYAPEIGRFINADDVNFIGLSKSEVSYNAFAYCENEPMNNKDYYGYAAKDITSKLLNLMRRNAGSLADILSKNISKYGQVKGKEQTIIYFIKCVKTGGIWDFKYKAEWKLKNTDYFVFLGLKLMFDDPGNIHFGYVGSVLFGEKALKTGAGLYQIISGTSDFKYVKSYFDDPRDSEMISFGCNLFKLDMIIYQLYIITLLNKFRRLFK